ncbi:MAG: nuclear transport factor 2 family protein [Sphingomonadaceae bacterium]
MRKKLILCALLAASSPALAEDARTVVEEHEAAHRAKDMAAFLSLYAADAEVYLDGAGPIKGRAAIRDVYALNFAATGYDVRVVSREVSGERVVDTERMTMPGGQVICCSQAEYVVRGGLIRQVFLTSP